MSNSFYVGFLNKINRSRKICNSMRPQSQRTPTRPQPKHYLQSKFKTRTQNSQTLEQPTIIAGGLAKIKPTNSRHNHTECNQYEETFKITASRLSNKNFSHHDPTLCLCQSCNCGRHMCKMHVLKPNLTKKTNYQHSFFPQKAPPCLVLHAQQYEPLRGPNLDMKSTYHDGYTAREGDQLERPKPQDILHTEGPSADLTSYAVEFPGHRGSNQYVRPTDRHCRGYFPLKCKSTYAGAFVTKSLKKDNYKYMADQLKTGSNWLGTTTYNNFYAEPNPEYMAKKVRVIEKKEEKPADRLRFKTTYNKDFDCKTNPLCPAKIYLQTHGPESFDEHKANFGQNSDFKNLSKNYHAISTSKYSYL